jgi:tRNA G18 (ribose-2'-O)-methylase SpoU
VDQFIGYTHGFYFPIAVDNNVNYQTIPINKVDWSDHFDIYINPPPPLFIFGEEGCGIPKSILDHCNHHGMIVEIPQFGSVRSLNVASAASIVMYDYVTRR